MYRYKTIRSPPITDNVTCNKTIALGIIVTAKKRIFDISTETKIINILKKHIRSGDLCMP